MLRSLKELRGYDILTAEGLKGTVADFYFDDARWTVRYLVADLGGLLPGRKVLISPAAFRPPQWEAREFPLALSRKQIEASPDVDTAKPVSRRQEEELAKHFGWPLYWMEGPVGLPTYGFRGLPHEVLPHEREEEAKVAVRERKEDPHLRSVKEVLGYR